MFFADFTDIPSQKTLCHKRVILFRKVHIKSTLTMSAHFEKKDSDMEPF